MLDRMQTRATYKGVRNVGSCTSDIGLHLFFDWFLEEVLCIAEVAPLFVCLFAVAIFPTFSFFWRDICVHNGPCLGATFGVHSS